MIKAKAENIIPYMIIMGCPVPGEHPGYPFAVCWGYVLNGDQLPVVANIYFDFNLNPSLKSILSSINDADIFQITNPIILE